MWIMSVRMQCYGNEKGSLSVLLAREGGSHLWCFYFYLKLENSPTNVHLRPLNAAGTTPLSLQRTNSTMLNLTLVFCWMLYRRNCNALLSSSLRGCYISDVCFALQLAALWGKTFPIVLGNSRPSEQKIKKNGGGTGFWRADLGRTWRKWTSLICCSCFTSNNRASISTREPNSCRSIKPNQ